MLVVVLGESVSAVARVLVMVRMGWGRRWRRTGFIRERGRRIACGGIEWEGGKEEGEGRGEGETGRMQ